jgi:FixJ family two-component response regulator
MTAPFRKWTPEEDARLLELIAAGKTSRSIAMDLKRAKTSIDGKRGAEALEIVCAESWEHR